MITATSNSQIKNITQLMTKSKVRREQKAYIIEGIRMFLEVPKELLIKAYICENSLAQSDDRIKGRLKYVEYDVVSEKVFKSISGTVTPQGILAIVKMKEYSFEELIGTSDENALFMILEDIQDPGNLGTIMRSAEATGVKALIMSKGTVDIYNPKVIRSTMGTIYRVPFIYVDNILEMTENMKQKGINIVAAHLKGDKWYDEISYKCKTAFIIGNEGNGISDELSDKADILMKIPMEGKVESLNASVAASVLMYEAYRQRRK
ncbi:MAG: 23S rRNA (guanosine(2251)-2'-O)-methyltransferase RlmB [Lachnospiraceae bacterium]|nr:23S rRNA (guanosine(2251)-2'-O)-methyltransferase RlmB [Lachnospiraceae bacterium]